MSHVFISYARGDEPLAIEVADCLRSDGFEVWRDDELPAHRAYADVIEERINGARAVVVLWSAEAAKSHWVRAEADTARGANKLVQASLDGTLPPMPFNQIQCADLKAWDGQRTAPGWRKLAASVGELAGATDTGTKRVASRDVSICVLPFQNMSGDPEQEYFSDGISEDITTDLSKVSALEVIARNTAFTFKGQSVNVCEVARKLGVTHVLEGSVRKVGGRVRINAQLIDGASGGHLWADRYDRDLTDIFTIQDEIGKAIVAALKLKLMPAEKKAIEQRRTTSAEAYNLYLLARQYWITGNHGDVRREERVMRICSRAVEIDPYYADAWALLAMAQSSLRYSFGRDDVDDGFAAANAALSIDPNIPQARLPIVKRHQHRGNQEKAAAEMEAAIRLGGDSWEVNKEAGRFFLLLRDVPTATGHYEKAVELMEGDFGAWAMLSTCYMALGDQAKLRRAAEMMVSKSQLAVKEDPSNGAALGILAGGHALLGNEEKTREWIDRALLVDPENLNMRYNFACVLAAFLGDKDGAIKMLESTIPMAGPLQVRIADSDTDLDCLRDNPRFQKLMEQARKRVGMEQPKAVTSPA